MSMKLKLVISMDKMKPSMWQYTPNNSPLPLPNEPFICGDSELYPLEFSTDSAADITFKELDKLLARAEVDGKMLEEFLISRAAPSLADRLPILLLGELANPFQLSRLKLGYVPVINVRLQNLCRTYADSLDSRMIRPGIHHVTLARSEGWWELTHLAFATLPQVKKMIEWLNNRQHGDWRPVKPNEGMLVIENNRVLSPPPFESLNWDGNLETCIADEPPINGPRLDITQVMVPIHTKHGCYDNRGRLIRCVHVGQREFHANYFRRGSSKRWQDILRIT